MEYYIQAKKFFTPLKISAFMVLCLAILDGFNVQIFDIDNYNFLVNFIIRVLIFNAAFFTLFGNGSVKRTRASVVSLPFLYYGVYNIMVYITSGDLNLLTTAVLFFIWGIWLILFGDIYE
ncbi:MAG: hypothetical protein ACUVT3_02975 [Ignavibacterium sp.]